MERLEKLSYNVKEWDKTFHSHLSYVFFTGCTLKLPQGELLQQVYRVEPS